MSENSFVYMACGVRMYTKNCQDRSANEQVHNGLIYSAYRACLFLKWVKMVLILFFALGPFVGVRILNGNQEQV